MSLEETQPHTPMSPENSSSTIPPTANSAERVTRREAPAFMRLEQDIDQGKFNLSPDIQFYADNILQAQNSGQLGHEVWVNTMNSVHNIIAGETNRNRTPDDYRLAGNIILRACQEREGYLAIHPNERQVGEDDAIEDYRAIARDYYLKRAPAIYENYHTEDRIQGPDPNGQSWNRNLVHDLSEWENLVSPDLQTEIELLAEMPGNLLDTDELKEADRQIRTLIREGYVDPGDMPMAKEFLSRIRGLRTNVGSIDGVSGANNDNVLERIASSSEDAVKAQREALDLASTTYQQFVENQSNHVIMFPPKWIENPPGWYKELSEAEKSMVRAQMHINFIASRKDAEGSLDAYFRPGLIEGEQDIKVQIESEGLGYAWMNMPGYRVALVSLMNELFELSAPDPSVPDTVVVVERDDTGSDKHKVYLNNRYRHSHLQLKEKYSGANLISGQPELMRQITTNLAAYLENNPHLYSQDRLATSPQLAAEAATIFAWNTVFMSGAIDSADRRGKNRTLAGPHISTDSVRSMFMPLDKAMFKLDKESPQDVEEKWGGPLGDWFADRSIAHGSNFADEVKAGKFHYFPERMFYGWMDYLVLEDKTTISDREQHIIHTSWGQAILRTSNVDLGNGLMDVSDPELLRPDQEASSYAYQQREWKRSFRDGGLDGDLWWRYSARAGAVRKMYELLTEDEPKSDAGDFATAFSAVVSTEPWLRYIYYDKDFITAVVAKLALTKARANDKSAKGFVLGTDELLLDVNEHHYDSAINSTLVLLMPRLYKNPNQRREVTQYVLEKLHSVNTHTALGVGKSILGNIGTGRSRIRLRAAKEISDRYN